MKNYKRAILCVFISFFLCTLSFANNWTNGSSADQRWDNPDNWSGGVPTLSEVTNIDLFEPDECYIVDGISAYSTKMLIGTSLNTPGKLVMTGGSLYFEGPFKVGLTCSQDGSGNISTFIQTGGEVTNDGRFLCIAERDGTNGYVELSGDAFFDDVTTFNLGNHNDSGSSYAIGEMLIKDTAVFNCSHGHIANNAYSQGTLTMEGGTLNASSSLTIANSNPTTGHIQLNNGQINAGDFYMGPSGGTATMDIEEGTLKIAGDVQARVNGYINDNILTSYGGSKTLSVSYEGGYTYVKTANHIPFNPVPQNGDVGVAIDTDIYWSSIGGEDSFDVYFGTSETEVQNADNTLPVGTSVYKGNQTGTSYDPGFLEYEQTYYWRIDSIVGSTIYASDVWQFTVLRPEASSPSPYNGEEIIDPTNLELTWTEGDPYVTHDVYFGTDYNDVLNADTGSSIFVDNFTTESYTPTVDYGETYYWRVDETYNGQTFQGEVWNFSISPLQARDPQPADWSTISRPGNVNLSWTPDDVADSFNVYFGMDFNEVNNAEFSDPPGNVTKFNTTSTSYNIGDLNLNTEYYWRVDEVIGTGLARGDVWRFKVNDYHIIDEFSTYEFTSELLNNWTEGGNASATFDSDYIMKVNFDNSSSPYYSDVVYDYSSPADWNTFGCKILEFALKITDDTVDQGFYVSIEDNSGTEGTYFDTSILENENQWQWIALDLDVFEDQGVDLSEVKKVKFGTGTGSTPYGSGGYFLIDNIHASVSRCFSEMTEGDIDGDCYVGFKDLDIISRDWLLSDYHVTAQQPSASDLALYYQFDETSGSNADDSSGNNYDGTVGYTVDGTFYYVSSGWNSSGYSGGCIDLDGSWGVKVPESVFSEINDDITISMWVSGTTTSNIMASLSFDTANNLDSNDFTDWQWVEDHYIENSEYDWNWNHYAFVKDSSSGTMTLYINGMIAGYNSNAFEGANFTNPGSTYLGASSDGSYGFFNGKVDEFKIFSKALSHEEVLYLAQGAGAEADQEINVMTEADKSTDGSVDIEDFEKMAGNWLQEDLWP